MVKVEPRRAGIVTVPLAWRNLTSITISLLVISTGASRYPGSVGGAGDFRIRGQVFSFNQTPGFANINEPNITVSMGGKCEVGKLRHRVTKFVHKGDP